MAKIENFKNEYLDLGLFPSAMIFPAVKKQFGKPLQEALKEDSSDMEVLAFIIHTAHVSYCKIKNTDVKATVEDLLDKMTIEDMTKAVSLVFPSEESDKKEVAGEKKT